LAATLQDIAKATRTSVSTVSRVLAGGTVSSRISPLTRQRVTEAAARLGYRPNLVARSLRTRRSHTVALLVSDIANPFFGQIGSLIEQSLHRHGYSLMLCNSGEDPEREAEYLQLLRQKSIDGLIVVPLARTKKALTQHLPSDLPLVVLDRPIPGIASSVASDQDQAAAILCDTLDRAGVRQVAIVAGPQHIVTHRRRKEIFSERFKVIAYHEGPAQKETGRQAFIRFLNSSPRAIACTNNFLAQGVIDSIAKIDAPPIIGVFDEIPMMHLLPLPIVCSMQDIPMLAEGAVTQILLQLRGQPSQCRPILLPARRNGFRRNGFRRNTGVEEFMTDLP
jgi:LacI family transcriptional regulator